MEGYTDEELLTKIVKLTTKWDNQVRDRDEKIRKLNSINESLNDTVDELRRLRDLWYGRADELKDRCDKCYSLLKKCLPFIDPRSKLADSIREIVK